MLLICIGAVPLVLNVWRSESWKSVFTSISYALVFLLLGVAAASPAFESSEELESSPEIVFLEDRSRSMVTQPENISIDGVEIDRRVLASGNGSRLGSALRSNLVPNTTYLVSSDMRSSDDLDGVSRSFRRENSSIYFLEESMEEEYSVYLEGPKTAVPDSETEFRVYVESTGEETPEPSVEVDGEEVEIKETDSGYSFSYRFSEKGYHRIEASIGSEDVYSDNNRFYRTVKVIERPDVLVLGEEGELSSAASRFFDLTHSETLPEDLSKFYAVVLKEKTSSQRLESYVSSGNGLIYTGDGSMDLLPVKEHDYSTSVQNPKIILGFDISKGNSVAGRDTTKKSQNLTAGFIGLLRKEQPESLVGVFAYNETPIPFGGGQPRPLSIDSYFNELSKLKTINSSGQAYQIEALNKSRKMIGNSPGNIILISDFKVPPRGGILTPSYDELRNQLLEGEVDYDERFKPEEYERQLIEEIRNLPSNISFRGVGVGQLNNDFIERLNEIDKSNVQGYHAGDAQELNSLLNEISGGGGSERKGIGIVDANHWITEDLGSLRSTVREVKDMKTKLGAETLVETSGGRDFLSTWRYGLGRVAAFSAAGESLGHVISDDPVLVSRTLSWAIGNPERKQEKYISVDSGRYGEDVSLVASYPAEGFVRSGPDTYRATTNPESLGFHRFLGASFGYNYRKEVQQLGYDAAVMRKMSSITGGEVLERRELSELREAARQKQTSTVSYTSLTPWILTLTMLVFLAQAGYRKRKGWL